MSNIEDTSILIIYTGGTIGMVQNPETGALKPFNFDSIHEHMPELKRFHYHIDSISFDPIFDSSDINVEQWIKLATIIKDNYEQYDGFVVLHGSDTMSFTASALSFMLKNLSKPVVLTGSQLPLGMLRTDGRENFISAIEIAASREDDTPIVPEVTIFFENTLYRGNRTYKFNAENFNAFVSTNYPKLADAGVSLKFRKEWIHSPRFKKLKLITDFDQNVAILKLFPGMQESYVRAVLEIPGLRAVIIESFGSGNATTQKWFIDALKEARDKDIVMVNLSQCLAGRVDMGKYDTSILLEEAGMISGRDLTTAAALTKLMICLGMSDEKQKVIELFQKPWSGEMAEK